MAKRKKIQNIRSKQLVAGLPKSPSSNQMEYGEIAINYAKGNETLSIKNSEDEIVTIGFKNVGGNTVNDVKVNGVSVVNNNNVANITIDSYTKGESDNKFQEKLNNYTENPTNHTASIGVNNDDSASSVLVTPKTITLSNFTTYSGEMEVNTLQLNSGGLEFNGEKVVTESHKIQWKTLEPIPPSY